MPLPGKARWWKNLWEGATGEHTVPWCSGVTAPKAMFPPHLQCMFEYFIQSREMQAGEREKKRMQKFTKHLHPPTRGGAVDNAWERLCNLQTWPYSHWALPFPSLWRTLQSSFPIVTNDQIINKTLWMKHFWQFIGTLCQVPPPLLFFLATKEIKNYFHLGLSWTGCLLLRVDKGSAPQTVSYSFYVANCNRHFGTSL